MGYVKGYRENKVSEQVAEDTTFVKATVELKRVGTCLQNFSREIQICNIGVRQMTLGWRTENFLGLPETGAQYIVILAKERAKLHGQR